MLLRRAAERLRHPQWMAIAIDLAIVVLGVLPGIQLSNWNEARIEGAHRGVVDAFRTGLSDYTKVIAGFRARANQGRDAFDSAYSRGERPVPFYVRAPR
jgi:hypothetical protein